MAVNWKKEFIYPTNANLPICAETDVIVAGGGPAGVAAAQVAAELGNKVLLIEKNGFLGGAAVAGYSGTICGMYLASDNLKEPEQTVFGFTETFYQALKTRNGVTNPQIYGKTYTITHDPLVWKEVAEDLILEAGGKILYHTSIVGTVMDEDAFKGLVVDTKSGQAMILAKVIIDATGDADVLYRAGYEYTMGDHGIIQNPTMIFRVGGVDMHTYLKYWGKDTISPVHVTELIDKANASGEYDLPRNKIWIFDTPRPNELLVNATRIVGADGQNINVTNPFDHTEAEIQGRKQARQYYEFLKKYVKGCENIYLTDTSSEVGVRQTRTIKGIKTLTNQDVAQHKKCADGIARSPWPIELHAGEKPKLEWLIEDYYEVPYGTLVPIRGENIIVCGRNLSAEHEALASARVTAQCFEYGHAAAIAADFAIKRGIAFRNIQGEEIRECMNHRGSKIN